MKHFQFKETYSKDAFFNIEAIQQKPAEAYPVKHEAHAHDYYVIVLTTNGKGTHTIDYHTYAIEANSVFFISPHQVHKVVETIPNEGYVISFNDDFLVRANISNQFFTNINLFQPLGEAPPLIPEKETFLKLLAYCKELHECFQTVSDFRYEALGAILRLFFIQSNAVCDLFKKPILQMDNALITLRKFINLVETHYKLEHKTSFYAEKLFISANYLNKLTTTYLHTSAKEYIMNRVILETKRMLGHTSKTVKEITFELGFQESSHLSHAFKNYTGESISTFKTSIEN
ncbi:helix-turn-helix domain-containing protein [Ascidiimonas sp. W6]|uniref:helix-turn-helix domain-containing protein n=1 Tax=Ascidiimonas meishanensis TaxID=3128903 RepID=UPI0030EB8C2A